MHIESLFLQNYRCFGPEGVTVPLASGLTAFVGVNGAGKTAAMQALQRLFGITTDQRRIRRGDFHVPSEEHEAPSSRSFVLEAILAFPELTDDADDVDVSAVPQFFRQMACDHEGRMKCRLRLEARLVEDGSAEGAIDQTYEAIRTLETITDADRATVGQLDRARIQMVYVPASRDGASQVSAFLRGRLWRAISWSEGVKTTVGDAGNALNDAFLREDAVRLISQVVTSRWQEVHTGGTDAIPVFQTVDTRFEEVIRKVAVVFRPDEHRRDRPLEELSDGQRSLFHLAMTAAALDVERRIADGSAGTAFQADGPPIPALTLIAIEEPENSLAPFYLSRIVGQVRDLTGRPGAQALLSSHSASILSRIDPEEVRYFRLGEADRTTTVKSITLPKGAEEASKFVREAVRIYPELYFARFVLLGEGASEEVVLPRLAEALGIFIDRSFVAMVPLGGRHVNHLWKLLSDLGIPHATLLDLDLGRDGGGWGRIRTTCEQLLATGRTPEELFGEHLSPSGYEANLNIFTSKDRTDTKFLDEWCNWLHQFGVYFSCPLDLDYSMLRAFPDAYEVTEPGRKGPSQAGNPRTAVLGDEGTGSLYPSDCDEVLRWYRYLFLGRGKPGTHVRVLGGLEDEQIRESMPPELKLLVGHLRTALGVAEEAGAAVDAAD